MKEIVLLGSTGSIGTQALEVVRAHKDTMRICSLAAHSNIRLLERQAREFHPALVVVYDDGCYSELKAALADTSVRVAAGMEGLCEAAALEQADVVLNAVVGMVGLRPTLAAIGAGKDVALANKETLVTGGRLVTDAARLAGVRLLPVDSEHSAIFQCLRGNEGNRIRTLILTASGGPFFGKSRAELSEVTVTDALAHPNWHMGAKITVDSATMMNKGLELIEAALLFDVAPADIDILVHRQSIVHSLVEYADGAVIAQLGLPDMKLPIQYALTYPARLPCPTRRLSLADCAALTFERPDYETFGCLRVAIAAIQAGGTAPAVVNGANEAAVALFLAGKIPFLRIGELVEQAFETIPFKREYALADVFDADVTAREFVSRHTT